MEKLFKLKIKIAACVASFDWAMSKALVALKKHGITVKDIETEYACIHAQILTETNLYRHNALSVQPTS